MPLEGNLNRLKGTEDLFGADALSFERAERTAREVFRNFGFKELRTPFLEPRDLFTRALGTGTDVVQKEMYEFVDRSEETVALRPEGTAGVVRAYVENHFSKNEETSRFFYIGPMFRRERPQKGRLRQFHQIGAETIGCGQPWSDAEMIHCLWVFLQRAGVEGARLKLNNLGTLEERVDFKEALKLFFRPQQGALCPDCRQRLEKNVLRVLDCKVEACKEIVRNSPKIAAHIKESRAHYEAVLGFLKEAGVPFEEDPYLVRGLDYYTKTVFEITHEGLGAQDAVAAGGRYDGLVASLGGETKPAVGFAVGIERLLLCLGDQAKRPEERPSVFLITLGENATKKGFVIASKLRASGVSVLVDTGSRSLKGQMRGADRSGARFALILGDNELAKREYALKDMLSGAQEFVAESTLEDRLRTKLSEAPAIQK